MEIEKTGIKVTLTNEEKVDLETTLLITNNKCMGYCTNLHCTDCPFENENFCAIKYAIYLKDNQVPSLDGGATIILP